MLVQAILELINYLRNEKELSPCDRVFYEKLDRRFSTMDAQHALNTEEMHFLDNCCKERLLQLPGSNNDALRTTSYWIEFASKFAVSFQKHLIAEYSNPQGCRMISSMPEKSAVEFKQKDIHPCWILIISLLTTRFEISALDKRTIWIWDKTNLVGKEPAFLFDLLWPSIKSNHKERVEQTYNKLIKNSVEHEINDVGFVNRCTRYESTTKWLIHVKNETLQQTQDIHWFEPEVFLAALVHFKSSHYEVGNKVTEFLDQLICTYTQSKDELQKILRVNILFTEMMGELSSQGRLEVLTTMSVHNDEDDKENFIKNCQIFIHNRLEQLSSPFYNKESYSFFNASNQEVKLIFPFYQEVFADFGAVIDCFKLKLNANGSKLAPIHYEKLSQYLTGLSRPILSIAELERAQKSSNNAGYLGAWS